MLRNILSFIGMLILGLIVIDISGTGSSMKLPVGLFVGLILVFLREPTTSRIVLLAGLGLGAALSYGLLA